MDFKEFETTVKKLDKSKYRIYRVLGFTDGVPEIVEWKIFRKDLSEEEYNDMKNLAILSSDNKNTIEDILKLIEGK